MAQDIKLRLLDQVRIASPCTANWDEMTGDERSRHCAQCNLRVFNLSGMTTAQAEEFLASRVGEARTCVSLFRRADGTILTADCPVGLALLRAKVRHAWTRVAAVLGMCLGSAWFAWARTGPETGRISAGEPFVAIARAVLPQGLFRPPIGTIRCLGAIAPPAPPPAPAPAPSPVGSSS